jgi:hypothetical protein
VINHINDAEQQRSSTAAATDVQHRLLRLSSGESELRVWSKSEQCD